MKEISAQNPKKQFLCTGNNIKSIYSTSPERKTHREKKYIYIKKERAPKSGVKVRLPINP